MENFERLSNEVLIRTCPCGMVFETYDPKKVYHSNKCRTSYAKKNYRAKIAQRRKLKSKSARKETLTGNIACKVTTNQNKDDKNCR
jgi:hypothetical protein